MDDRAALDLLVGAVQRPSPSGSEAAVAAYLAGAAAPFADQAGVDAAGNVSAHIGTGPLRVLLLGHIDTAPGFWPVRADSERVHGRGAVDAKGPFCAMMVAASRLSTPARRALTVHLLGAVEEEAPSSRGVRFALDAYPPPDRVVVGEPSGWDGITLGYKGRLRGVLTARRPSGHSAFDEPTACAALLRACADIEEWALARSRGAGGVFDAVSLAVTALESADDGLEQVARATLSLRLPPALLPADAERELGTAVTTSRSPGAAVALTCDGFERAYRGERDTPLTRAFRTAIRGRGGTPRLLLKSGTSDMNVVAPVWRVPMLAYGPGDNALDHTPAEHLRFDDYLRAVDVLVDALELMAGRALSG